MRRRFIRALASWVCLVTILVGGMAPEQGYILCLGMNGHVEVSPTGNGCDGCETISQEPESGPRPDETGLTGTDGCCPCLDIPVVSSGDVYRTKSHRFALELSGPMTATLPAYLFGVEGPKPLPLGVLHDPPDASRFVLPQLRSVILVV